MRDERTGRVVQEDARGPELGQLLRRRHERVRLVGAAGAVHEARVERSAGVRDRRSCLAQVGDVVQRVVEPEDLDPVLGRAGDEPAHDVAAHGARANEEAPPQRNAERRRDARLDRADALPRALDAPANRRVEHAAARDLEAREPRLVEDLRDAQHLRGRQVPRERLLREQPDGRVDELRHGLGP